MAEIHTIHGGSVPQEADEDLVSKLEDLLRLARSGQLQAFAYAVVGAQGDQTTGWVGLAGTRHVMGTTIAMLNHRYVAALLRKER